MNGKVNGELKTTELENIKILPIDIENDKLDVITPPLSTPAVNLLSDISNDNNFDLSWNFVKSREDISSTTSLKSDDSLVCLLIFFINHWCVCVRIFLYLFVCSFVCLFVRLFVRLFICLFVRSLIHSSREGGFQYLENQSTINLVNMFTMI